MSTAVCLAANTLYYPEGGGHRWAYLNWALGLREVGCKVFWLEPVAADVSACELGVAVAALKRDLEPYGLADAIALHGCEELAAGAGVLGLEEAAGAELLLNLQYDMPAEVVGRFRRTGLVDLDPGLTQIWIRRGALDVPAHDIYFTIGESVPDCGLRWHHTPPCVALAWWPPHEAGAAAPYTTVAHWWGEWLELNGELIDNSKRAAFAEYLDLPSRALVSLELALSLGDDEAERRSLERRGWLVREAEEVTSTAARYQQFIQRSRAEFSCAKPAYVRLQTAWMSDRTVCYLASGKPAAVQHTGPSRFLPEREGLFRFRSLEEAACALSAIEADYERHSRRARELAEEHFAAERVVGQVLERAVW